MVLLPLEQVVIRRLTVSPDLPGVPVGAVAAVTGLALGAGAVTWLFRGRLFGGDGWYSVIVLGTVVSHSVYAVGRGYLAGRRRYRSYGISSGAAAVLRLALAGVALLLVADGRYFALALVAGPLVIFAWRPFGESLDASAVRQARIVDVAPGDGRLMAGLVLASAAAQAMLLAGPGVAALMGASATTVSVVFATFTLFRSPISLGANLIARILPPFTTMAEEGHVRLAKWSRGIGGGAAIGAVVGAGVGALLGPGLVQTLFGPEFRPAAGFTAAVAAGVVLAVGGLVIGQIFVARGDAHRLADAWLWALGAAALCLALPLEDLSQRVAAAFLVGEIAALGLMVTYAGVPVGDASGAVHRVGPGYRWVKRGMDLVLGVVAGLAALPVIGVIAIVVLRDSGRPVLIHQERVGRGGSRFLMWKFRTMSVDVEEDVFSDHIRRLEDAARTGSRLQPDLHIRHDPRITRVGGRLRRWSLDELPNLWNVIAGDMSLVGPRPLLPQEVALIGDVLGPEAAATRALVAPGVTGLAQVQGRDDITIAERSEHDATYIASRSLSLDLWILLKTVIAVLRRDGA
jgi:lipopolysaccharide/colanic/teichoic acid biosynthesis glycosyltransferase